MAKHEPCPEPQTTGGDQAPRANASFSGIRAVVAAGNAPARHALAGLLRDLGILVVAAARDGREATDQARAHRPHLVLMDLGARLAGGIEAMRAITAEVPRITVVLVPAAAAGEPPALMRGIGTAGVVGPGLTAAELAALLSGFVGHLGSSAVPAHPTPAGPGADSLARRRTGLSWEEEDVLAAFAAGHTRAEVARSLGISVEVVDRHVASVFATLHRLHRRGPNPPPRPPEPDPGAGGHPPTNLGG